MALKVPNQAEVILLQAFINQEDLDLRLFKNNHTPVDTDTEADYTEADFIGYATELLVAGNWTFTPGDPALASYAPNVIFTSTAGGQSQTIYGYYVTQRLSGKLLWAEKYSDNDVTAPYTIVNLGDTIESPLAITGSDLSD
jgi:hypothetical protein